MEKVINSYESLFIVDLVNGEEAAKATADKFLSLIKESAELVEASVWGKRRLAYPINDKPEGYYVVATFKSDAAFPAELERVMNIDEAILRSMVIRLEHEAVAKAAPAEDAPAAAEEEPAPAPEAEASADNE